jgi:hypothetical protein
LFLHGINDEESSINHEDLRKISRENGSFGAGYK